MGTKDLFILEEIAKNTNVELENPKTSAKLSLSFGVNTDTYGVGAVAMGQGATAGCKGYYWYSITSNNKQIQLTTEQKRNDWNR